MLYPDHVRTQEKVRLTCIQVATAFLCVKRIFTTRSAYFTSSKCAGLITKYCEQDANPMHVHNYNIFILDIAIALIVQHLTSI